MNIFILIYESNKIKLFFQLSVKFAHVEFNTIQNIYNFKKHLLHRGI